MTNRWCSTGTTLAFPGAGQPRPIHWPIGQPRGVLVHLRPELPPLAATAMSSRLGFTNEIDWGWESVTPISRIPSATATTSARSVDAWPTALLTNFAREQLDILDETWKLPPDQKVGHEMARRSA